MTTTGNFKWFLSVVVVLFLAVLLFNCGEKGTPGQSQEDQLILGAYTVPKDAYQKEIIPAFQEYWQEKTGRKVTFSESYIASGAQSRAIAAGMEADIAALSLEDDIVRLARAGLITHDWKAKRCNGFVTRSLVVLVVRPQNPKQVKNWEDLTADNIDVIYPSPKTSGGAMWFVNAIYGAGLKMTEVKNGKPDPVYARDLLKRIQKRVKVMNKSGRESVTTFEKGFGDVLVTYENEALLRQMEGKDFPFIIPDATILIENPVAVVDKYVDKHGTREVAEAFIDFLYTKEVQRSFAKYGFRSVDEEVLKEFAAKYPVPPLLFDMSYLGGWDKVSEEIYGTEGIWTKIIEELGTGK
jgi:sulfate/thiosulfate-binding protein